MKRATALACVAETATRIAGRMKSPPLVLALVVAGTLSGIGPCAWADKITLPITYLRPGDAPQLTQYPPPYGTVTLTLNEDKTVSVDVVMAPGYFTNSLWFNSPSGVQAGGLPANWQGGVGCSPGFEQCFNMAFWLYIFPPPPVSELSFLLWVPGGFSSVTEAVRPNIGDEFSTAFLTRVYGTDETGGIFGGWESWTGLVLGIDIQQGSSGNRLDVRKGAPLSVAVLSTPQFDAPTQVDRTSLTFGRTGDEASLTSCNRRGKDVNRDGMPDLVCSFSTKASGFQAGDTQGVLKGTTVSGTSITGSDVVIIVTR